MLILLVKKFGDWSSLDWASAPTWQARCVLHLRKLEFKIWVEICFWILKSRCDGKWRAESHHLFLLGVGKSTQLAFCRKSIGINCDWKSCEPNYYHSFHPSFTLSLRKRLSLLSKPAPRSNNEKSKLLLASIAFFTSNHCLVADWLLPRRLQTPTG